MSSLNSRLRAYAPYVLSILRIVAALLFLEHGLSKFFGWPMPARPGSTFELISIVGLAAVIETVGSVLVLLGLFTRIAAFVMSGEMAVAYFTAHLLNSFFPLLNRGEGAVFFCFVFLYLVFAGPGPWSLDAKRGSA